MLEEGNKNPYAQKKQLINRISANYFNLWVPRIFLQWKNTRGCVTKVIKCYWITYSRILHISPYFINWIDVFCLQPRRYKIASKMYKSVFDWSVASLFFKRGMHVSQYVSDWYV